MDHKELRGRLNEELEGKAFATSLLPEEGKRVTSGLSSGSMMLNMRLSGSPLVGYAWGRIVEIYGPEACGKTTLALQAIYEAQRLEKASGSAVPALFVDAEHVLDPVYASSIGIDMTGLSVIQPDCGEDALDAVEKSIEVGYKLIIVDSVAALTPRSEIEGEMGDSHMGLQARLMSQACRKLTSKISKSGAVIIFINQIRMRIGTFFGNPEVTTGGRALKFYASYRIDMRAPRSGKKTGMGTLAGMGNKAEIGTVVNIKVVKNKLFPPYGKTSFYIEYGVGIDRYRDAIDFLVFAKAFKKSKNENNKIGVLSLPSRQKAYTYSKVLSLFRENSEVQQDVIDLIHRIDEEL